MGVGLQTILKTAGWSRAENFKKLYRRETDFPENAFAEDQHLFRTISHKSLSTILILRVLNCKEGALKIENK